MKTLMRVASRLISAALLICSAIGAPPTSAASSLEKITVPYRTVDGHKILADVYRPKGAGIRPVIVYIHGGALMGGNRQHVELYPKTSTFSTLKFAEDHGYAVVSIDYRLAPETKLPAIITDIEAAFAWLGNDGARRFHLDTNRIVVLGGSAGGYLTLVTGYRVNPKPKALVAFYGYGELNADWCAKPNPYPSYNLKKIPREEAMSQTRGAVVSDDRERKGPFDVVYMYYRQNGLWPQEVSGFAPETLAKDITAYEPFRNVTRDFPATLLVHGTQDTDVPFEESAKMSEQFRKHGVPYILLPINKGEHGFAGGEPKQIEDAHASVMEFMRRNLEPAN